MDLFVSSGINDDDPRLSVKLFSVTESVFEASAILRTQDIFNCSFPFDFSFERSDSSSRPFI